MRRTGDRVPDFDLATDRGDRVSSTSLRGRRFVLYFYPKDDTPGCTREACSFRDYHDEILATGAVVLGVVTLGTAAKGRVAFEAAVERLAKLFRDVATG